MRFKLVNRVKDNVRLFVILFLCKTIFLSAAIGLRFRAKAIIFDCDSVLVDTEYLKFLAWQEALASYNIDFSIKDYVPFIGHSSINVSKMIEQLKKI